MLCAHSWLVYVVVIASRIMWLRDNDAALEVCIPPCCAPTQCLHIGVGGLGSCIVTQVCTCLACLSADILCHLPPCHSTGPAKGSAALQPLKGQQDTPCMSGQCNTHEHPWECSHANGTTRWTRLCLKYLARRGGCNPASLPLMQLTCSCLGTAQATTQPVQ